MPYMMFVFTAALLAAAAAGWLMRSVVSMSRTDLFTGALGAAGAVAIARWRLPFDAPESLALTVAVAVLGAVLVTFVAHLAVQSSRPARSGTTAPLVGS